MRQLLPAVALALLGCASTPAPYPVEPQSVTVNFLSESEWVEFTTQRTISGSWAMPGDIGGSALFKKNDAGDIVECEIFLPAGEPPSRYVLSHELRHCSDGSFH